jgi:hypothetical protein
MVITQKQSEALDLLAELGPMSESNETNAERRTLYHATAARLLDGGLVREMAARDRYHRRVFGLTGDGKLVAEFSQKLRERNKRIEILATEPTT